MARINHRFYMLQALEEAKKAQAKGEVPIGAVVVCQGEIIARAHNLKESWADPTAHAEILAIREAAAKLKRWRLTDCTLYVTLEPCPMCAGAIVQARLKTLVYGAMDPKAGAVESTVNLVQNDCYNHRVEVYSGICEAECKEILADFFKNKRPDS